MALVQSGRSFYEGTFFDIKRSFYLNHNGLPIFERYFNGSSVGIVSTSRDNIYVPNHFFATGEEVSYTSSDTNTGTENAIGIATTSISGIGVTDKLPTTVYIVKSDDLYVQVAASASEALRSIPTVLDITSVGIGSFHKFTSKKQNSKLLLTIDNSIQSPIVSTSTTTSTSAEVYISDDSIDLVGITSFFVGNLIKINNEIMRIDTIGIGNFPNKVLVQRPWMGTGIATHAVGSLVTKVVGDYNITDNLLNFVAAPYGVTPISTTTNPPDERDYLGISTHSTFSGRVFLRSGITDTENEPYYRNYVFDDISSGFAGLKTEFTLKSNSSNIAGISTSNAIILINDIFQQPSKVNLQADYSLKENLGITSISFSGFSSTFSPYDINTKNITRGGIIVSVAETGGFGYQPLVSAGGTAVVSVAGTISSIAIGNSGSGYRVGIQTTVRVGVTTLGVGTVGIQFIGTAVVSNGHIVSVAITNPGIGYTQTNPPLVVFDDPLSYSNLPLIYSSSSVSGFGTEATVDIVVGQGSSVINFELKNTGYNYGQGEILTVRTGGTTGIPTNTSLSFKEFRITVDRTFTDKFAGWTFGDLQVLDSIDNLFDGNKINFPIKIDGQQISFEARKGSNVDLQANLLVFINDILQVPGEAYFFKGGSIIRFAEAPKVDDRSKLLFYRGTSEVDLFYVDILETIKVGDNVTINSDSPSLQEDERLVTEIVSSDVINTNIYPGPGITTNQNLLRPIEWCRQTEDRIINEQEVSKNRTLYEALVQPTTNLIQNVGVTSTVLFVESVKTFFDSTKESNSNNNKIAIISQDSLVAASATAVVSAAGTISSIIISDGGVGYSTSPNVSIAYPVGYGISVPMTSYIQGDPVPVGLGTVATFTSTISVGGTVSLVSVVNAGSGYTSSNPPLVIIEPPIPKTEVIAGVTYNGDFGVIVGFGRTTITSLTKMIFDLHIPSDSYLRNSTIVGTAYTLSSISSGDYFVVYDSNIGVASTNVVSRRIDGSSIGIGTQFIDNVYQIDTTEIIEKNIAGIGITYVKRIFTRISGISTIAFDSTNITFDSTSYKFDNTGLITYSGIITTSKYIGNYSWGKISLPYRKELNTYNSYVDIGISGISTSAVVVRSNPLKYQNYLT